MGAAEPVSEWVGRLVAHERKRRGWTQERLAEAIAEHGGKLNRAAVAKIESGVRNVSIDEALLLAAAVNVPPGFILFPLGHADVVEITPRSRVHPRYALRWLAGETCLMDSEHFAIRFGEWAEAADRLYLWAERQELLREVNRTKPKSHEPPGAMTAEHREALVKFHTHHLAMVKGGHRPGLLGDDLLQVMRSVELDVSDLPTWPTSEEDAAAKGLVQERRSEREGEPEDDWVEMKHVSSPGAEPARVLRAAYEATWSDLGWMLVAPAAAAKAATKGEED